MAASPQMNVKESRANDIIIMLTCMLSNGEESTGIMWLICGFIWLMWDTSKSSPDSRNPKVSIIRKRL